MIKNLFCFIIILSLSACVDFKSKEIMDTTEERIDSPSSASNIPKIKSFGEFRGRFIHGNFAPLDEVLGKPHLDYTVGRRKVMMYFFAAEQDQTVGHIRVIHDYSRIDQIEFFKPGDRIYLNQWQYIFSPEKEQSHYSSIKIQE